MLLWELLFPPVCPFCGKLYRGRIHADDICPECRRHYPVIGEPYCTVCGKPLHNGEQLCHDCASRHRSFDGGRALWAHEGAPRRAVYDLKFHDRRVNAEIFGRELAAHFSDWLHDRETSLILPVPLHKRRRRERGYNQAALIARTLSRETGIPCREDLLRRTKATKRMKVLDKRERSEELRGVFEADFSRVPEEMVQSIVLIDDIFTTGATMEELAVVCKCAGAKEVRFLTVTIGEGI